MRTTPPRTAVLALAALIVVPVLAAPPASAELRRPTAAAAIDGPIRSVLVISIDGLNPDALADLGPERAPAFHRLLQHGASTLNARTAYERTRTLPNHTGMMTGRPIDPAIGGHGVTFNADNGGGSAHTLTGGRVASVFGRVHRAGGSTALAVRDLHRRRSFRFVHLSAPDRAGHRHGWMGGAYLRAVRNTDRRLGRILRAARDTSWERRHLMVLVTADHGGAGSAHEDPAALAHHRVPLFAWGAGVARGNLYDLNPAYADPGTSRPGYRGRQPIRNGDIANLSLSVLGLGPVPGSRIGYRQQLNVLGR
ncbi:MAG: alkaline phosphatase [Nocardioides sp.]